MNGVKNRTQTASETEESARQHAVNSASISSIRTVGSLIDLSGIESSEEGGDQESGDQESGENEKRPRIVKFTFTKVTRENPRFRLLRPLMAEILYESCFSDACTEHYNRLIRESKRTYVGESINPFVGKALFAAERIEVGDFICLYFGTRIPWAECEARLSGTGNVDYFLDVTKGVVIDGSTVGHGGAMANHSCVRNAELEHGYLEGRGQPPYGYIRAVVDIEMGDEIEVNYRYWDPVFDPIPNLSDVSTYIPCRCLKVNCRHVLRLR